MPPDPQALRKMMMEEYFNKEPDIAQVFAMLMRSPKSRRLSLDSKKDSAEFRALVLNELWQIATEYHEEFKEAFDDVQLHVPEKAWHELKRIHYDPYTTASRPFLEEDNPYIMNREQFNRVLTQLVRYHLPKLIHPVVCEFQFRKPPTTSTDRVKRWPIYERRSAELEKRNRLLKVWVESKNRKFTGAQNTKLPRSEIEDFLRWVYKEEMAVCPIVSVI